MPWDRDEGLRRGFFTLLRGSAGSSDIALIIVVQEVQDGLYCPLCKDQARSRLGALGTAHSVVSEQNGAMCSFPLSTRTLSPDDFLSKGDGPALR